MVIVLVCLIGFTILKKDGSKDDHQEAWDYFNANGISAYTYGCEKITDDCGKTYYGVYYGNMEGEKYYY